MGQNQFTESLVEVMLSWMRWLAGWFWGIINSGGTSGGFLSWFSDNWLGIAVFLIIAGVVVDWLIWMIRWRPYWLWFRKRQIIYEEVPVRKKRRPAKKAPAAARKAPVREEKAAAKDEFFDPFAEAAGDDPYAVKAAAEDDLSEWDSLEDPYARAEETHAAGKNGKKVRLQHARPAFGERMNRRNVDGRQSD